MEIDEVAARVVRGYWALLLVMTVVPLALVGVVMSGKEPPSVAQARLQASSRATDAAPGDAGVSIVVSQVKAFATSDPLMRKVLKEQKIDRSTVRLAKSIEVTGLGTSTIVELSVRDADPATARRLADAIGAEVVREINESNQGVIRSRLDEIDKRVRELEKQLGPLSRRAGARPVPDIGAANERERVQAELSDLRSNRSDLQTQLSTAGTASVVQPAVLAPRTNPAVMMAAVAGLVGLIGGILIAVVAEMLRPTIPGQRRVARRLGVPLLGWADRGPERLADTGRRIRLAAAREGLRRVVLVGAPGPLPAEPVSSLAAAVYGDGTKVVKAAPGAVAPESAPEGAPETTAPEGGRADDGPSANSAGPGEGKSTSVVRAGGTAVLADRSAEVSPAATRPEPARPAAQPVPGRRPCRVHAFEDIDPGSGEVAGVVAVVGPVTRVSGLETVLDLVAASGWPLLGVVATSRRTNRKTNRKTRG